MSFVFFIDRSLGRHKFISILEKEGLKAEAHDDHLPITATDEQWLELVGRNGWIAVTKDRRIRYRSLEMQALLESGVRTFLILGKDKSADELARQFLKASNKIHQILTNNKGPFIAKIYSDGKTEIWVGKNGLLKK